jgi:hypothetical protein
MRSRRDGETPTIPRAAATANVSRPSGKTSAMSLATTERAYGAHKPGARGEIATGRRGWITLALGADLWE